MVEVKSEHQYSDIIRNSLLLIDNTIKSVQFFYHNTLEISEYQNKPLPTNEFSFIIDDPHNPKEFNIEELKENSHKWLTKKSFEDFILAINISLVEANKLIKTKELADKSKTTPFNTEEEIRLQLKKIDKDSNKLNLPTLISNVETWLNKSLFLEDKIKSINNVRACFAHRNGKVHEKDIKDKSTNLLTLSWTELETDVKLPNGEWVKLTYELRKDGVEVIDYKSKPIDRELKFAENEWINLNIDNLSGIGLTCIFFIQRMYQEIETKILEK